MMEKKAIRSINSESILLVFPIKNKKEPASLWSSFYPRSEMIWEWDEKGDDRVSKLWHLREELSRSRKVIYTKWYQGRATFFSLEMFKAFYKVLNAEKVSRDKLSPTARQILNVLEMDSPLSTKQLKAMTELRGKNLEGIYTRALKELWNQLLVVGFGEVDEGAFPSLAIGASHLLFEDLVAAAREMTREEAFAWIRSKLPTSSPFLKHLNRCLANKPLTPGKKFL